MGSKGSQTTNTNQQQSYTPTGANYITGALNQAQGLAGQNLTVPTAPVAGLTGQQQQAFGLAGNTGIQNPYLQQAQSYFNQGAQPNISQFFNPEAGAVTAQLNNIFGQQNQQNTANLTQSAGGVGADRIAVGQGELANQQGLSAGQTLAGLYTTAGNQALQEQSALQGAGYGMAGLGAQAQGANTQDIQNLLTSGGLQQQQQQAQLNAPYQQQLAQMALPYQLSNFYTGTVGALAPSLGGTSTGQGTSTTQYNPSIMSQILGGGLAATGIIGGTGGFGSNGWLSSLAGKGSGGAVPYAAGGTVNPFAFDGGGNVSGRPIDVSGGIFGHGSSIVPAAQLPQAHAQMPQLNLNMQGPDMQAKSEQGMGQLMQLGKAAGQVRDSLSGAGWGGGSMLGGDAWGGSASNPLPGLDASDYGARGGTFGSYDIGGAIPIAARRKFDGANPYSFFKHRFPQGYDDGGSTPDDLDQSGSAIAGIESGGEKNPYAAVGPSTRSGDHAYGKYQIMGANIPQWTQEATGAAATPQQFVNDPQLQEQTFRHKFGQYTQKYGPEGAAKAWFAGERGMNNPNARDSLGTSVAGYAQKFDKAYGKNAGSAGLPSVITQGTGGGGSGMPADALGYSDTPASDGGDGGGGIGDALQSLRMGIQKMTPNVFASGRPQTPFATKSGEMFRGLGPAGAALAGAAQPDILTNHIPKLANGQAYPTPPVSRANLPPIGAGSSNPFAPEDINQGGGDEDNVPLPRPRPAEADQAPGAPMQLHPDEAMLPPNAQPTQGKTDPSDKLGDFFKSPWATLLMAGLGAWTPGGISGGLQQGMKFFQGQEGINQAADKLRQEAKFHEDQYTRVTPYQQFEMKKPQAIGKNIWGQPVMGVLDQKSGNWVNPSTGKPVDAGDLHEADDAYIESQAQAIAHYQQKAISPYKITTPVGAGIMARARQIAQDEGHPYNEQYYQEAQQTRDKFAAGVQGDTVRSYNTTFRHLDLLKQALDAMNNGTWKSANALRQEFQKEFSLSSAPTTYEGIRNIAGDELTKAIVGGRPALADREEMKGTMDARLGPKVLHDMLDKYKTAALDQLQSYEQQYTAGTHGDKNFGEKLSPEVRDALESKKQEDAQRRQQGQQGQQGQGGPKPSQADALAQAKAAIAAGKPRAAVIERMKQNGFDTTGL
jgi:hypothetical protein